MNLYQSSNPNFDSLQAQENLIFIDPTVDNYRNLISDTLTNSEIVILDSLRDGIAQITDELARYEDLKSIHIISHGELGSVRLGNTELNLDTFDRHVNELQSWDRALTSEADILLYGCNIGGNLAGEDLIDRVSDITSADVAASNDLTGSAALGGDWELELATGQIEASLAFTTEARLNYEGVLASENHSMMMESHTGNHTGHQSPLLDLVPHDRATHVAVQNGSWFDPNTWNNGRIPDNGADVLIPKGYRVRYTEESDARLDTLRVDGAINFALGKDTKMLIDTFVVSPEGKLNIGNARRSVRANKTARIIFTSDSAIDPESDVKQLGKGLISEGQVGIYGTDKLDFIELQNDALAGDNQLQIKLPDGMTSPTGWQVGDRLVLGGTYFRNKGSDEDNTRFHDEVLTITAIDGDKISFTNNDITSGDNTVLRFDHQRPEGFENRLNLYVANTTRNVVFETENGDDVPINHRGHVMFMHNPNVVVQNAGFYNLGRTDKNRLIDDPEQNVDGTQGNGTNPRGRYSLHFHRTGADNWNGTPAIAKGNAVVGSPGWGIAHHDSYANIEDNVVFDVVGAGIAAEAGNEIGTWSNNITIKTTGDDLKTPDIGPTSVRVKRFDYGFNGEGYWVQGAGQIEIVDNIAISAAENGIMHYGGGDGGQNARDAQTISVDLLPSKWRSIAKGTEDETVVDVAAVPLRQLSGFETYNSKRGIGFWASMKNLDAQLGIDGASSSQGVGHNFYSEVEDFTVWNVRDAGVSLIYSSQVELDGGLILGSDDPRYSARVGISGNFGANRNRFKNLEINGFETGLNIPLDGDRNYAASKLVNSTFKNNTQNFGTRLLNNRQPTDYPEYFQIINNTFEVATNNVLPTANFSSKVLGNLAVEFDGLSSFDPDSSESNLTSQGITSYGWDFDNDGTIDSFGRRVTHSFERAGNYQVALKVWDNQGTTNTKIKTVNVTDKADGNLIINSGFSSSDAFIRTYDSRAADLGWIANTNWSYHSNDNNNGYAIVSGNGSGGLGQIINDNYTRRGEQTLSLNLKNTEGNNRSNEITVTVWGVNGEFSNPGWKLSGPQGIGAIPMNRTNLLQQTVGGSTFNWNTFEWNLDFGKGYQFVVLQINYDAVSVQRGDFVAVDNVKIKS